MKGKAINILWSSILTLLSITLLIQLKGVPKEGTLFPSFLIYALLLCSVLLFIRAFLPKFKDEYVIIFGEVRPSSWCIVVAIFICYIMGMFYIGFYVTTFISSLGVVTIMSLKKLRDTIFSNILFSIGLTISLYLFFSVILNVPFPDGILF